MVDKCPEDVKVESRLFIVHLQLSNQRGLGVEGER